MPSLTGFLKRLRRGSFEKWQARDLQRINERVSWLRDRPEGKILDSLTSRNCAVVEKHGSDVTLYFVDPETGEYSGAMSEIDLDHPLVLNSGYPRSILLSLIWKGEPERVYMAGFGGGRVSTVLRHFFPGTAILSAEVDPGMLDIARRFFGVELDDRQRVVLRDARECLKGSRERYDIIIIDAYEGVGSIPYHLTTAEFFGLCRERLTEGGVVAVNLTEEDPLYADRVRTLESCFGNAYLVDYDVSNVAFGTDSNLDGPEMLERTAKIQERLGFGLTAAAERLKLVAEQGDYLAEFGGGKVLRDKA